MLAAEEQSRPSYMPTLEPVLQCSSELLADEDWEREALAAFADLRQYLAYWAAQGIGAKVSFMSSARMSCDMLQHTLHASTAIC
jgi:hypothetical protein